MTDNMFFRVKFFRARRITFGCDLMCKVYESSRSGCLREKRTGTLFTETRIKKELRPEANLRKDKWLIDFISVNSYEKPCVAI